MISKLHQLARRTFATQSKLVFRNATAKDAPIITRNAIQEGWHVGAYDFQTFMEFDPKSYYICEIDGKVAAHIGLIQFPKHHCHGGSMIVKEEYRNQGVGFKCLLHGASAYDTDYTLGTDVDSMSMFKPEGFTKHWDTYIAMLDLHKIAAKDFDKEITAKFQCHSIREVDIVELLEYDQSVFGTPRNAFIKRWINTPGSFGWAAIDKSSDKITGYTVLKQVIRGGGTEIGLAVAPLFADNAQIAKFLINIATKECLTNPAIPKTKLEIFHPVGDNCGEDAAELMRDLNAELIHIAYRIYNKGIPPGRQLKKIYGIASPSCD